MAKWKGIAAVVQKDSETGKIRLNLGDEGVYVPLDGEKGDKGDRGDQGIQGTQGIQGPAGSGGAQGIQGTQGVKGDKGDDGADGTSVTILGSLPSTADLPSTGDPGDGYLIDGFLYVWIINSFENVGEIKGPKGDKGDQGSTGIQGPKGDTGEQGVAGGSGPQGTKGDTGSQGIQGVKGDQGIQGVKGDTGATGSQGPQGVQGPAGLDATVPDSTSSVKGKIRLAGDLGGTAESPTVPALAEKLPKSGGQMTGDISYNGIDSQYGPRWDKNTDYAKIYFESTGDLDNSSNQIFETGDNLSIDSYNEGWIWRKKDLSGTQIIDLLRLSIGRFQLFYQGIWRNIIHSGNYLTELFDDTQSLTTKGWSSSKIDDLKQSKTDNGLNTTSKTVVGGINEVKSEITNDRVRIETNSADILKSATYGLVLFAVAGQNYIEDIRLIGNIPKGIYRGKFYDVGGSLVTPSDNPPVVAFNTVNGRITFDQIFYQDEFVWVLYSQVGNTSIIPGSVVLSTDKITTQQTSFIYKKSIIGKNIFNKSQEYTTGARINTTNGSIETGSFTSKVSKDPQSLFGLTGRLAKNGSNNNYVFLDANGVALTYNTAWGTSSGSVAIPANAVSFKIQIATTDNVDTLQIESGSVITIYEAYNRIDREYLSDNLYINQSLLKLDTAQINKGAVSYEQTSFIKLITTVGKNIFNKDQAWQSGSRISASTGLIETGAFTSQVSADFQPLFGITGQLAKNGSNHNYVFYDAGFLKVGQGGTWGASAGPITLPSGAVYYKIQLEPSQAATLQIEAGILNTLFEPYVAVTRKTLDSDIYYNSSLAKVSTAQIDPNAVTVPKVGFITKRIGKNIFNKNQGWIENSRINGGGIDTGPTITSKVSANYESLFGTTGILAKNGSNNNTLFFDANFQKILPQISSWGTSAGTITIPSGAVYYKIQINTVDNIDTLQIEKNLITEYEPYVEYTSFDGSVKIFGTDVIGDLPTKNLLLDSITGQDTSKLTAASLLAGQTLTDTNFPYHTKKGWSMSMYADLTSLIGAIDFGKGIGQYRGDWISVDSTKIYWKHFEQAESVKSEIAHGKTISSFIKLSIYVDDSSLCTVILSTLSGVFKTTFNWSYEANYAPFLKTTGQELSNIKVNSGGRDFSRPVWAFGDSYFGISTNRWPGVVRDFGYFNFMINGLAGQTSSNAYTDLVRALKYGTPKYLIWCLGMNDTDALYQSNLTKVIALCASKNIKLILSTIPTVPTRPKEVISGIVRSSGFRYIDMYKAMGANSSGVWYSGYLDADGIHPSILGAGAQAAQVLCDFPELMEYGTTSISGNLGNTVGDN